jgi:tRNA-uridine 2-sulfurtransferase
VDPGANLITLARRRDLETNTVALEDVRFVAGEAPADAAFRADFRIRHRGSLVPATVRRESRARWSVDTDTPVWAAAPGQAAVLYDGDRCLGGGRITSARAAA